MSRGRAARPRARRWLPLGLVVAGLAVIAALRFLPGGGEDRPVPGTAAMTDLPEVPAFDPAEMEPQVIRALEEARAAAVASRNSADAWGRYGIVLDAHDLHEPAVICYRAARALEPGRPDWPYLLARSLEIVGAPPEEYLPLFDETLALRPAYAPAHARYGEALLRAGRSEEAEACFERALALDPELAVAHRDLGRARLAAGDAEAARISLQRAVELHPEDGAAWGFLAQALARTGERAAAREAQTRSRSLEAEHVFDDPILARVGDAGMAADQCLRRANTRLASGDPVSAVRDLEIARAVHPDDEYVRALLGGAYSLTGRPADAIAEFERALEIREAYPEAHRDYASLLVRIGRYGDAVRHYRRALELSEPDVPLLTGLAAALAQSGDPAAAVIEFERAARLGPLDARAQLNWGTAWAAARNPERAAEHFLEATRLDPRSPNAWGNLGLAREEIGDREGALEAYREAVRLDPTHRVRGRLEALGG